MSEAYSEILERMQTEFEKMLAMCLMMRQI